VVSGQNAGGVRYEERLVELGFTTGIARMGHQESRRPAKSRLESAEELFLQHNKWKADSKKCENWFQKTQYKTHCVASAALT
jgi:hypothetical protein